MHSHKCDMTDIVLLNRFVVLCNNITGHLIENFKYCVLQYLLSIIYSYGEALDVKSWAETTVVRHDIVLSLLSHIGHFNPTNNTSCF